MGEAASTTLVTFGPDMVRDQMREARSDDHRRTSDLIDAAGYAGLMASLFASPEPGAAPATPGRTARPDELARVHDALPRERRRHRCANQVVGAVASCFMVYEDSELDLEAILTDMALAAIVELELDDDPAVDDPDDRRQSADDEPEAVRLARSRPRPPPLPHLADPPGTDDLTGAPGAPPRVRTHIERIGRGALPV